ncbi:MAG: hypothetical protein MH137_12265 [Flavobacteriales bacterium]|nr:hypothetical protein [Flavobacteriales bacterium]
MNILVKAHSGLPFIVLGLMLFAIIKGFMGASGNKPYSKGVFAAAMGFLHIQVILGLILYVQKVVPMFSEQPMGEIMKDSTSRFLAVEHISVMLIAAIVATVGFSLGKRAEGDAAKNRKTAIFYLIAFILILSRIPWGTWTIIN